MWDIEVDIACVGAGIGAMASAAASADAGCSVLVATPRERIARSAAGLALQPRVGGVLGSWERANLDLASRDYLAAVSGDVAPSNRAEDARLTRRTVRPLSSSTAAENFVGAKLRDWNAQCLASPYGMLVSNVSGWRATRMRTGDGQSVEVRPIGAITTADLAGGDAFLGWMTDRVRQHDVEVREGCELERIVFDNGRIVGVVLAGPHGTTSVGVRQGLSLSAPEPVLDANPLVPADGAEDLQVCVVGQVASRFLRIELLETAAAESAVRPMCSAFGRQLRSGARGLPSGAGTCGKPS
jgi:predicted oxidoreductase